LFKTFSHICFIVQWSYSRYKLRFWHHHEVGSFLPPDCITRVSGQDSQQQRKRGLTKISQNDNSTIHTNIKVVSWVKKYEYKLTFHSYGLPQIILTSYTSSGILVHDSTALPGLDLLYSRFCDHTQVWITRGYSTQ